MESDGVSWKDEKRPSIVLIAGFESFNTQLYGSVKNDDVNLSVFADKDIRGSRSDGEWELFIALCVRVRNFDDLFSFEKLYSCERG